MRCVDLTTSTAQYSVHIGDEAIGLGHKHLRHASFLLVVSDQNVAAHHGPELIETLRPVGVPLDQWVIPPGEQSKSLWQAECLYDFLVSKRVDKAGMILALGGGVVGDLAGFVASTWLRGIGVIQCPTSLLAAVDASVGGKTALNHVDQKNAIGTFHQPRCVLIRPRWLQTLPEVHYQSGLAESIKHALIASSDFLEWQLESMPMILKRDDDTLIELIARNVEIKASFVRQDERDELQIRAALNLGHTVGHALEVISGYDWTHGQCVSLGMVAAFRIAHRMNMVPRDVVERVATILATCGLPIQTNTRLDTQNILQIIQKDKKSTHKRLEFVLPSRIGQVKTGVVVEQALVEDVLGGLHTVE